MLLFRSYWADSGDQKANSVQQCVAISFAGHSKTSPCRLFGRSLVRPAVAESSTTLKLLSEFVSALFATLDVTLVLVQVKTGS